MFNRSVQKKHKEDNVSHIRPVVKTPAGRERLQHFDEQISLAKNAIAELEQRIERCEGIIRDADIHHRALQAAIEADNGASLAHYSEGLSPPDSSIARLVLASDNSGRASTAAKASLPTAHAQLENARAQLLELHDQRAEEAKRVLMLLGDATARKYVAAFELLGDLHDQLVGFASVAEGNQGDIWRIQEPLAACRFALPSTGDALSDPFHRHRTNEIVVGESTKAWAAVKDRLSTDALADISDLI
jgi:hypothetical protein